MKNQPLLKVVMLLIALPLSFHHSYSQGWIKDMSALGFTSFPIAIQTYDEGYLVTGQRNNITCLMKMDANGDTLWTRDLSYLCGGAGGFRIQETTDLGFIFSMGCAIIIKFNSNGDTVWTRSLGDYLNVREVRQTADGGYIAIVRDGSTAHNEIYLFKLNDAGEIEWSKRIEAESSLPGWIHTNAESVDQTIDGGYLIGGNMLFDTVPYYRVRIIKTDAAGDTLWTREISNDGIAYCVRQSETGNGYVVAGQMQYVPGSAVPTYAYGIVKLDTLGHFDWGIACLVAFGYMFDEDASGQVFSVGNASNSSLRKVAPDGTVLWQQYFPGLIARSLQQTSDKGFIVTAEKFENYPAQRYFYMIKADSNGTAPVLPTSAPVIRESYRTSVFPNPANGQLSMTVNQEYSGYVRIELFDIAGQSAGVLADKQLSAGEHSLIYSPKAPSGIYFLKVSSAQKEEVIKIILETSY